MNTALKMIRTSLENLKAGFGNAPTRELVRVGADLWDITTQLRVYTDSIKDTIRERTSNTPGQYILKGPGASCMVTVQGTKPSLRKDVDIQLLRTLLGDDFNKLFDVIEVANPRADFEDAILGIDDPHKVQAVLVAVDLVVPKPRVSFQLFKGSRPKVQP